MDAYFRSELGVISKGKVLTIRKKRKRNKNSKEINITCLCGLNTHKEKSLKKHK